MRKLPIVWSALPMETLCILWCFMAPTRGQALYDVKVDLLEKCTTPQNIVLQSPAKANSVNACKILDMFTQSATV